MQKSERPVIRAMNGYLLGATICSLYIIMKVNEREAGSTFLPKIHAGVHHHETIQDGGEKHAYKRMAGTLPESGLRNA